MEKTREDDAHQKEQVKASQELRQQQKNATAGSEQREVTPPRKNQELSYIHEQVEPNSCVDETVGTANEKSKV
jgi:hypothetical protein